MVGVELRLRGEGSTLEVGALEDPVSSFTVTLARVPPDGFFGVDVVVADVLTELQPGEEGQRSFDRGIDARELRFGEVLRRGEEGVDVVVPREAVVVRSIFHEGVVGWSQRSGYPVDRVSVGTAFTAGVLLGLSEEHTSLQLQTAVGMADVEATGQTVEVRGQRDTLLVSVGHRGVELRFLTTTRDAELIVL